MRRAVTIPHADLPTSLTLAVVADAAFWMVFLLGYATIGLVVSLRRPANPTGCRGRAHDGCQVSVVSYADL